MDDVVLTEYDPKWLELFEQEAKHLLDLLGDLVLRIEHVGNTTLWAARLLNGDDADLDIAAALVAGAGEHRQTATRLGSAAHQRLGEPDVERYSYGNRNRRADGCGRAYVGGGIGRRDTGS